MSQPINVVISGQGSISAAGPNSREAFRNIVADRRTWSVDASTGLPVYRIADLPEQDKIAEFVAKRKSDRTTLLALHAADQAVVEAGWEGKEFAILVGCSRGPTGSWEEGYDHFGKTGSARLRTSPQTTLGGIGFGLSAYFGTSTLASSMSVTCSSGFHALLHGIALLEAGMVERVLVGGVEAPLTTFTLRQMEALRIYAQVPTGGKYACHPLQSPPTGMAIGEGAAFLALTKGTVGTRITGLGFSQEHSPSATGISTEGLALQGSMAKALEQCGHLPDGLVLHAPGTERGDAAEQRAIASVLGEAFLSRTFSSKPWTGHTFGASGPLGLDFALSRMQEEEDGGINSVLVNATGFGGNAVSVVVRR